MFVAAILFTLVSTLWVYYIWSRRKYYAFALKMPGPIGLPFIGILHKVFNMADFLYEFPKIAAQYKVKTYFSWLGSYPLLYTMDPKIAEIVLNSPAAINKSIVYDVFNDLLGMGLLTLKSPKWNKHRKLINPSFTHKILLSFFPRFNKVSRELCEKFDTLVNCGEVDIKELIFTMSLKAAIGSTMGLDFDTESHDTYMKHVERGLAITVRRGLHPLLRNTTIFRKTNMYKLFTESQNFMENFVKNLVLNKIKAFEEEELKDPPEVSQESVDIEKSKEIFIEQAIKFYQRNEFTFEEILNESNIMVSAAFETTATTVYSVLIHLAMNPRYQEKVFEEIVSVFPDEDVVVSCEHFKDLMYLDMCINETMRLTPSVPVVMRACSDDLPLSEDIVVPKGTQVLVDMFNIHRDEDNWGSNAMTFDPDHFLPENLNGMHKYSFIPFLKGPRNCIGWQYAGMFVKVALVHVLRKYRFSTTFRFEDLRCEEHVTMKYVTEPKLAIEKRR